jgi:hypothetical protein
MVLESPVCIWAESLLSSLWWEWQMIIVGCMVEQNYSPHGKKAKESFKAEL